MAFKDVFRQIPHDCLSQMPRTVERANRSRSALWWIAIAGFFGILVLLGLLYWRWNIAGKSVLLLGFMLFGTYLAAIVQIIIAKREDRVRKKLFPEGNYRSVLFRRTREQLATLRSAKKFEDADGLIRRIFLGFGALAICGALLTAILGYFVAAAILGMIGLVIALLFGTGSTDRGEPKKTGLRIDKD